jgi:H+-transporting ATPase
MSMPCADKAATVALPSPPATPVQNTAPSGLTSKVASARLQKDGSNAMPDTSGHQLRNALAKFWAPVPWLLEAAIILEVVLHKYSEAAIITPLLLTSVLAAIAFRAT